MRTTLVLLALVWPLWGLAYELPSSPVASDQVSDWPHMVPSSHPGTINSLREQCERTARLSESDAFTLEKCDILLERAMGKEGVEVIVPDDIVHDLLTGLSGSKSVIWTNKRKATGRTDRATLFDLGDGIFLYWYTGVPGQSCNNIGWVYITPPVVEEPPPISQVRSRMVPIVSESVSNPLYQPSTEVQTCYDTHITPSLFLQGSPGVKGRGYVILTN